MTKETEKQVDEMLKSARVTYSAKFKPVEQPQAKRPHELQVHWTVSIGGVQFDYQTGIGHLPKQFAKLTNSNKIVDFQELCRICEEGRYGQALRHIWHNDVENHPSAASVLYCILCDSDALDSPTFESWAADLGYDTDSRKAEQTYRACLENGLKLRRVLGESGLVKLRELLQDY
jgi:hypothetical protein